MNFKEKAKTVASSETYYDLFDGGYIKPDLLLEAEDAIKVKEAIKIIETFLDEARENGLLEEF